MPTRQEVAKLGRHLKGLEKYPMSASYPQESGDFEFKKMKFRIYFTFDGFDLFLQGLCDVFSSDLGLK